VQLNPIQWRSCATATDGILPLPLLVNWNNNLPKDNGTTSSFNVFSGLAAGTYQIKGI
jgi:hypothetical protein